MIHLTDTYLRAGVWLTGVTPSPTPGSYNGDENLVTPTWVGFAATAAIGLVTLLLILDMNRRVRRTRYRAEIREKLEAEAAAESAAENAGQTTAENAGTNRHADETIVAGESAETPKE